MDKLEPCLCGETPKLIKGILGWWVFCPACGRPLTYEQPEASEAVKIWNRQADIWKTEDCDGHKGED